MYAWNSILVTIPRPGRRVEVLSCHFLQPSAWQKDTGWMRSFTNLSSKTAKQEQQQGKQVKTIYEKTYQLKFKFHSIVFKCFQCIYETFVKGQLLNVINIYAGVHNNCVNTIICSLQGGRKILQKIGAKIGSVWTFFFGR